MSEERVEKLKAEKKEALVHATAQEALAQQLVAELAEQRAVLSGRPGTEAVERLEARLLELAAARDSATAEAETLRQQVTAYMTQK